MLTKKMTFLQVILVVHSSAFPNEANLATKRTREGVTISWSAVNMSPVGTDDADLLANDHKFRYKNTPVLGQYGQSHWI